MDTGTLMGGLGLFISVVGIIYSAINHKHIRSKCCGKELDFSIDIDSTEQAKKPEEKKEEKEEPVNTIIQTHIARVVPHFTTD
jgi:hypothetical protein